VGRSAATAVPAGARVAPDETTWSPDGTGGGLMAVSVQPPGGQLADYVAIMVREGPAWKVLATLPVTPNSGPGG
jgi:hypothetical protein